MNQDERCIPAELPRCPSPATLHAAGGCIFDEEATLQACLDAYVTARKRGLDVRSVHCTKCRSQIVDFDLSDILANTRVC